MCHGTAFILNGLARTCRGDQRAGLDEGERIGMVAAPKVDRLVVCAVDMDHLPRIKADADASRRGAAVIGRVPYHDVHSALAGARLVEGDHPLVSDGGENGLVGADRAEVLGQVIRTRWKAQGAQGEQKPQSHIVQFEEREHDVSPFDQGSEAF